MTLRRKTLDDVELRGRRALVRVDFNVPLEGGRIADDTRIRAALPTLRRIADGGASAVLASHLGRPKGRPLPEYSLAPVARHLEGLLGRSVRQLPDCVGPDVERAVGALAAGEVALLENVRFHPQEEAGEDAFARALAALGNVFVNDAFGAAHRAHASTTVVAQYLKPAVAGCLMQKELAYFARVLEDPARPLVAVLGGAKVSDKIKVIESLLQRVDALLVGGAMAYTFLKAQGLPVGASRVEEDQLDTARRAFAVAAARGVDLVLPADHVTADRFAEDAAHRVTAADGIEDGWIGLDIGPRTREVFAARIARARTVVWNGPMGVFEMKPFADGTRAVARALALSEALTVVGGGDSVRAVVEAGLDGAISHISTGGGASLELLEGRTLPGVAALDPAVGWPKRP